MTDANKQKIDIPSIVESFASECNNKGYIEAFKTLSETKIKGKDSEELIKAVIEYSLSTEHMKSPEYVAEFRKCSYKLGHMRPLKLLYKSFDITESVLAAYFASEMLLIKTGYYQNRGLWKKFNDMTAQEAACFVLQQNILPFGYKFAKTAIEIASAEWPHIVLEKDEMEQYNTGLLNQILPGWIMYAKLRDRYGDLVYDNNALMAAVKRDGTVAKKKLFKTTYEVSKEAEEMIRELSYGKFPWEPRDCDLDKFLDESGIDLYYYYKEQMPDCVE